jgi:Family of unknown function (DUF6011)
MTPDIFHCYDARLHTLAEAPTLRAANHEQLVAHHNNLEAVNADKIVPRFGTDPNNDEGDFKFFTSACHGMLEQEDLWAQCKLVWAWIDERPVWLSPVDWDFDILPYPEREMQRSFRFTLLGGGQITVIERFKLWRPLSDQEAWLHRDSCDLRVTADAGNGLRRLTGTINHLSCEMGANAVLFLPGTPQSIADRVAATFRLLTCAEQVGTSVRGPGRDNFMALLDRSEQCCCCGRALRDHVSTLLGIGPDCAKQQRLPHGLGIANKILQRRRELLGDAAASAEVVS